MSAPAPRGGTGHVVAALLHRAWRSRPEPPARTAAEVARALAATRERLLGSACGALVWWRLRESPPHAALAEAAPFRDAYRHHAIRCAVEAHRIALVVRAARAAGVEPLLLKGWATSRLYPEPGLRPPGDIDLCVAPGERRAVECALVEARAEFPELATAAIDLHTSIADLDDRPLADVRRRAAAVTLGDAHGTPASVLVPCAEDHLRLIALHLLRHGAWRPLWLADVGVVLDRCGASLDWDRCLSGSAERARRIAYVLGLAHALLGADLPDSLPGPAARAARGVPRWLVRATLRQWGSRYERYTGPALTEAIAGRSRGDSGVTLGRALGKRWPNPIEATVSTGAPFNHLPRLPIQLGDVLRRALRAGAGRLAGAPPAA